MTDLTSHPAEWLLLPGGGIRRVVTMGTDLVPYDTWLRAQVRKCACGAPAIRVTCGSPACVAGLWAAERSGGPAA